MSLAGMPAEFAALALETARTAGVLIGAPLIWTNAPMRIRTALSVLMAVMVHGLSKAPHMDSIANVISAVPFEFIVGFAMGFVARLCIVSAQIAGEIISPLMGLSIASLFDPHAEISETGITRIVLNFALLIAMAFGLHRVVLGSVIASFRILPVGSVHNPALATRTLVELSVVSIAHGLRLALPILAVLFVANVALAFISRAAPSMQIFSIGFAITLAAGATTMTMALPDMALSFLADMQEVGPRIERVIIAIAGL